MIVVSYRDDEIDERHPVRLALGEVAASVGFTRTPAGSAVRGRSRQARRAPWSRPRRAVSHDRGQCVLRDGGTRLGQRRDPHDGARRGPRPGGTAQRRGAPGRRSRRGLAASRRAWARGGALRDDRRAARRVHLIRHARCRRRHRRVSPRASPSGGRADDPARAKAATPPAGARASRRIGTTIPTWLASRTTPTRRVTATQCSSSLRRQAHASSVGAHREAAEQYARALRHSAGLPAAERAELLKLDRTSATSPIGRMTQSMHSERRWRRTASWAIAPWKARRWRRSRTFSGALEEARRLG